MNLEKVRVIILLALLGIVLSLIVLVTVVGIKDHHACVIVSTLAGFLVREFQTIVEYYFKER